MYLELYQQETEKLVERSVGVLKQLHNKLTHSTELSVIEEQAMLHTLQVLIENAIGKAKHILKAKDEKVPITAYELFEQMKRLGLIDTESQQEWKKIIGLRNTIVHEYMKVNIAMIKTIVKNEQYHFIVEFLNKPFTEFIK